MTKTTTYITGIALAVAFLVAAQVQADLTHSFTFGTSSKYTQNPDSFKDVANALSLTATDNNKGGIDFVLSSTWTGDEGGPGILMGYGNGGYNQNTSSIINQNFVSLNNYGGIFSNSVANTTSGYLLSTSGFQKRGEENIWDVSFTLNYKGDNDWSKFLSLLKNDDPATASNEAYSGFYLMLTLGELNGSRDAQSFASFDTALAAPAPQEGDGTVPEPATLALMGLGLAGLGMVSRRRRK